MFRQSGSSSVETDIEELKRLSQQAAAQDPQVIAAKNENQQLILKAQQDAIWSGVFRTNVPGLGMPDNTQANRQVILSWEDEARGDVFSVAWFVRVISEQPQLMKQLSWTIPLSAKERKAQDVRKRQFALKLIHENNLSEVESNIELISSALNESNGLLANNGTIVWANNIPYLFNDSQEFQLVPATEQELAKYEQERFEAKQQRLREMRDRNDIAGLQAASLAERTHQSESFESIRQQKLLTDLRNQYARDTQAGYRDKLPQMYDAVAIRKFDAQKMKDVMRRFGASRITARLYGITTIADGQGGTIQFE